MRFTYDQYGRMIRDHGMGLVTMSNYGRTGTTAELSDVQEAVAQFPTVVQPQCPPPGSPSLTYPSGSQCCGWVWQCSQGGSLASKKASDLLFAADDSSRCLSLWRT